MRVGKSGQVLVYLATAVLAIVALYFGKPILMPMALAGLPLMGWLLFKGIDATKVGTAR